MLPYRDAFLHDHPEDAIATCGLFFGGDTVHVGLYWKSEGEQKVVHFLGDDNIQVQDVMEATFPQYLFNVITDFPKEYRPSMAALAELVAQNRLNGFRFRRVGIFYDGGTFEFQTGAFTGKTGAEKFINCAVFVISILKTYGYTLLDWNSWPDLDPQMLTFLQTWLDYNHVEIGERPRFYNMTKAVRGIHILVAPSTVSTPSEYAETEQLASNLLHELNP